MNIIEYLIHKKEIIADLDEMDKIDRDYDMLRAKYSAKKKEVEDLQKEVNLLNERNSKHLKTIRELRKELKGLKNDN